MFGVIRASLFVVILCLIIFITRKYTRSKMIKVRILSFLATLIIITCSALFPIENVFINFQIPENAFRYKNPSTTITSVISGNNSAMVIGYSNKTETYDFMTKSSKGWKLPKGFEVDRSMSLSDGISITIYHHKPSGDRYIEVVNIDGGECEITDSYNSEFLLIKDPTTSPNGMLQTTYIAYLSEYNSNYYIIVNGNKIVLENS